MEARRNRRIPRAWGVLISASLALIAAVVFLKHQHRAHLAAYEVTRLQAQLAARQLQAETDANLLLLFIPDPANCGELRPRRRDELAQSLFPGRTPATLPVTTPAAVRWADPVRGIAIAFEFGPDGTWQRVSFGLPTTDPPPRPALLRAMAALEPYRRIWAGSFTALAIGPILWFALFATSVFLPRSSRTLAHAHLAVAWLCFLGWLLDPNHSISPKGIFSNDMLFWGALMLIASGVGFWIVAARTATVDTRRCRACGYDLTGNVSGVCAECGTAVAGGGGGVAEAASA